MIVAHVHVHICKATGRFSANYCPLLGMGTIQCCLNVHDWRCTKRIVFFSSYSSSSRSHFVKLKEKQFNYLDDSSPRAHSGNRNLFNAFFFTFPFPGENGRNQSTSRLAHAIQSHMALSTDKFKSLSVRIRIYVNQFIRAISLLNCVYMMYSGALSIFTHLYFQKEEAQRERKRDVDNEEKQHWIRRNGEDTHISQTHN